MPWRALRHVSSLAPTDLTPLSRPIASPPLPTGVLSLIKTITAIYDVVFRNSDLDPTPNMAAPLIVGVLALQGGVGEHTALLHRAATHLAAPTQWSFVEVLTASQLAQCDALIIPGGESTTMAIVARRLGLLDPLRQFVK